ncbi:hypothetical protein RRG08_066112 [Elysia crispata]|uniref:Uncharacterized protein n=1 Tax=Elysia crispata TaxID=231223 RepID=A0AAE0ZBX8_9GAST|nr:hypothetical protein RRG08_066112 [Elysia crispata]
MGNCWSPTQNMEAKLRHEDFGQPDGGHHECEILSGGPEAAECEHLWRKFHSGSFSFSAEEQCNFGHWY